MTQKIMKTADLISSYLNNEMTPEQERRFLLSVAASDSLRLSLKSHFMLDRIVVTQALDARVPDRLRENILSQAAASVAGTPPVQHAQPEPAVHPPSRLGRLFGRGALLALLVTGGYAAGYLTHPGEGAASIPQQPNVTPIVRPADAAGGNGSEQTNVAPSIESRSERVAEQPALTGNAVQRNASLNHTHPGGTPRRESAATVPVGSIVVPSQTVPTSTEAQGTGSDGDAAIPQTEQGRPSTVTVITTVTKPGASEQPKQPQTEGGTTP
jgi:hypothetical protein